MLKGPDRPGSSRSGGRPRVRASSLRRALLLGRSFCLLKAFKKFFIKFSWHIKSRFCYLASVVLETS